MVPNDLGTRSPQRWLACTPWSCDTWDSECHIIRQHARCVFMEVMSLKQAIYHSDNHLISHGTQSWCHVKNGFNVLPLASSQTFRWLRIFPPYSPKHAVLPPQPIPCHTISFTRLLLFLGSCLKSLPWQLPSAEIDQHITSVRRKIESLCQTWKSFTTKWQTVVGKIFASKSPWNRFHP